MSSQSLSIQDRIRTQVVAILTRAHPDRAVSAGDLGEERDLRELGLDSLGLVNLMLAIEAEFDIFIPQADMVPQTFRSVSTIATVVSALSLAA